MKLEELKREQLDENEVVSWLASTGMGMIIAFLVTDAVGILAAVGHADKPFLKALWAGKFGVSKLILQGFKDKFKDIKLKSQLKTLLDDPDIQKMMSNNISAGKFKEQTKEASIRLLRKKVKKLNLTVIDK